MNKIHTLLFTTFFTYLIFLPSAFTQGYTQWHLPTGATARFGKGWVRDMEFSPLGDQLAVATTIGIWIYDVHSGNEQALFFGLMKDANAISYSPGGLLLAAAHQDHTIRLWDLDSQQKRPISTFRGHTSEIFAVAFSPDGSMIASGSSDKTIRLWNPHAVDVNEQLLEILPYKDEIITVDFSPDSRLVAGGCEDGSIQVWDTGTGEIIANFNDHKTSIEEIDFSPDGKTLISASLDGSVFLYNLVTPAGKISEPAKHSTAVYSIDFSQDGLYFATSGEDKNIRIWDTVNGDLTSTLIGHNDVIPTVRVSPNGNNIASGSLDGTVRIWDTNLYRERLSLGGHTGGVKALIYTEDKRLRVCGTEFDGKLRLWDGGTSSHLSIITEHSGLTEAVAFSKNGIILASGGNNNETIFISDVSKTLEDDNKLTTDNVLSTLEGNPNGIISLALSPNGTTLASGGFDGRIYILDVKSGNQLRILKEGIQSTVTAVTFVSDGIHLFSGEENGDVRHWNTETGELKRRFRGSFSAITALAFSNDVEFLAIGGTTGRIELHEFKSKRIIPILTQHTRKITSLLFSDGNKTLTSGSDDGTILKFDLEKILTR